MTPPESPPESASPPPPAGAAGDPTEARPAAAAAAALPGRWLAAAAVALAVLATAALVLGWTTQQRVRQLEAELVRRQQDSAAAAAEARTLARQAETTARDAAAKVALLDVRVAETAMQRAQFEDLIQSLARSRDENVLADVEAAVRVAQQQAAITGSAEPLLLVLRQSDERLARYNQPRLERVRRAIVQDLERTRGAGIADITMLALRLDDLIRQVDDLPLLAQPTRGAGRPASAALPSEAGASAAGKSSIDAASLAWWRDLGARVWHEVRALVRVTPVAEPEAALVSPEQAYFLRENLKLRLLHARVALLSRHYDTAQSDLRDVLAALDRYFERGARRTLAAQETLRQVSAQARTVGVPRPDATLAAIAAAAAGR